MSNYHLLLKIIHFLDEFEKKGNDSSIENFTMFLNDKIMLKDYSKSNDKIDFSKKENQHYEKFIEVEFATLLTNLYRFAKHYVKKAFINSSLKSIDEFSFLATLLREGSLLKSDLINRHILEISTGSEVLKRLKKMELIIEFPDENDKRAKRVSLSKLGVKEITESFSEMYKAAQIVRGNMKDSELEQAIFAFKKLSFHHWNIHEKDRNSSLDTLHKKYATKR